MNRVKINNRVRGLSRFLAALLALAGSLSAWGAGGGADVIHVRQGAAGAQNGSDWDNAYTNIASAFGAVSGTRTNIWITGGSYGEGSNITLSVAARIVGGFAGTENAVAERTLTNALGVVTNYTAINGENSHKCLAVTANGDVWLDTLSISNSPSERSLEKSSGTGKLTLNNCRIEKNRGPGDYSFQITGGGCGAYLSSGSVLMTNCVVTENRCDGYQKYGTGISAQSIVLDIVDCLFLSNTNKDMSAARGSRGGGLAFHSGTCRVVRTEFINNQAAANNIGGGGAIYIGNGATMVAVISNCLFRGNYIGVDGSKAGYGGALNVNLAAGKTVDVMNCTFTANSNLTTASGIGGAIYLAAGTLNLKNCILWTNRVAAGSSGHEVGAAVGQALNISYSDITGTISPHVDGSVNFSNCISLNPLFASATDLHLQSTAGRWDPGIRDFVISDTQYSPCIDGGDPSDGIGDEPTENGNIRINLGYYGGTAEASKSPPPQAPLIDTNGITVVYDRIQVSGELTNSGLVSADVYFCYGSGDGGTTTGGWDSVLSLGERRNSGPFSQWTAALNPSTTYTYRLFATNNIGSSWTAAGTFDTGTAAPGGGANVIHVNKDATGAADGTSWPHAYTKIGDGITAISGSRSNIWITGVTYTEGLRLSLGLSANLFGGFVGTETLAAQRPVNEQGVVTNYTAINGEGTHGGLNITAGNVMLEAFVITNCGGGGAGTYTYPALSYAGSGTLVANNCRLVKNNSTGSYTCNGLGAYFTGGSVLMTNCLVADNTEYAYWAYGYGIYSVGANLRLVDCVVSNNSGAGFTTRGGAGAGLYFDNGTLQAVRTCFLSNTGGVSAAGGAAVCLWNNANTVASFSNCVFQGNRALNAQGGPNFGGAIHVNLNSLSKTVTVVNCTFSDNRNEGPGGPGGAIYVGKGTLAIKNSIFWTNTVQNGVYGNELYATGANSRIVGSYACMTGTNSPNVVTEGSAVLDWGNGIVSIDPLYAGPADVHLQSREGRWSGDGWVRDLLSSPCIDAGDPEDPLGAEPSPNGGRINLGAYGGTAQASKTPVGGTLMIVR